MAPGIFHRLTQAVKRMLKPKRLNATVAYLDDFFIKGDSFQEYLDALNLVISLLRKLGFHINLKKSCRPNLVISLLRKLGYHINWKKVVDPSTLRKVWLPF